MNTSVLKKFSKGGQIDRIFSPYQTINQNMKGKTSQGFVIGGTYLVAGCEKSGKSSFLMNMVSTFISSNRVGYINTELGDKEFLLRMIGIDKGKTSIEVEKNPTESDIWLNLNDDQLHYAGINDIILKDEIDFQKLIDTTKDMVFKGCKIICIDNLTTFSNSLVNGKKGWELLGNYLTRVINFAKQNNVLCFVVMHTKPVTNFKESPKGIYQLIKDNETERVFEESINIVTRPTTNDVYGGNAKTQLTGSILIWRPYQNFYNEKLSNQSLIIFENMRHGPSFTVPMMYKGSTGKFYEIQPELINNLS